jgi:hypothetical protein
MTHLEQALRDFDAGDGTVGDLDAAAEADSSTLAHNVLAILTEYENSDWDEHRLRIKLGALVTP